MSLVPSALKSPILSTWKSVPTRATTAPAFASTLDHIKSGNLDKVTAEDLARADETKADQLVARAEHHWLNYLKPGDRIPKSKPHLFDVAKRKEVVIGDDLFPEPWHIGDVRWDRDSGRFTFFYNQRGHQVLRIVAVTAAGEASTLVDEKSATFIDYAGKHFKHYLDATGELRFVHGGRKVIDLQLGVSAGDLRSRCADGVRRADAQRGVSRTEEAG